MVKTINPDQIQENIPLDKLLYKVMEKKQQGLRLVQICCAYVNDQYELSYSFADDETYQFSHLRVVIDLYEKVPSICPVYPYATFYENEMAELFDVNIEMNPVDYHGKFYRIKAQAPLLPNGALEKKEQSEKDAIEREEAARKAAEEAALKADQEALAAAEAKAKAIAAAKAKAEAAKAAANAAPAASKPEGGQN